MTNRMVDELKQDYQARTRRVLRLPWTSREIYLDPITPEDLRAVQVDGHGTHEQNVDLVIRKCKDVDGKPLFEPGDRDTLMRQCAQDRLVDLIDGVFAGAPTPAQALAAVTADPPSGSASASPSSSTSP
jgi:hypothetical protein